MLDKRLLLQIASTLLTVAAPYIVLDIVNFLFASKYEICFAGESLYYHCEKIEAITKMQCFNKNV